MNQSMPTYEKTSFGALLTMAAGGIDAYSYLFHGEVFAGLQTGNLILLGVNLGQGDFSTSLHYVISILAFFVGTILIRLWQRQPRFTQPDPVRKQWVLAYESGLLLLTALVVNLVPSVLVTVLLSFVAAAELQEFRRLNGGPFTPLMMTGNLRTLAETTIDALVYHDSQALQKLKATGAIMLTFGLGACLIALTAPWLHLLSILVPAVILLCAWMMLIGHRSYNR